MKGNINLSGGSITWDSTNTPVQYQFSEDGYNWHSTMYSWDIYRRDSLDGGRTWGTAYQFRGTDGVNGRDGRDGSDASVTFNNIKSALQLAAGTQTTFITADSAGAPNIYGGRIYGSEFYGSAFNVVSTNRNSGSLNLLTSDYGTVLSISYNNMGGFGPEVIIQGNGGTLTFSNWGHITGLPSGS